MATERELQMLANPITPDLRRRYKEEIRVLEGRIEGLRAKRLSGDLSEATRRQLNILEVKLQAVQDRLDQSKRRNNADNHYSIIAKK